MINTEGYHVRMRTSLMAIALVFLTVPGGKSAPTNRLLRLTCGTDSTIRATTTPEDLARLLGQRNIKEGPVYVGEGFSERGTLVFPGDERKEIGIIWRELQGKRYPATVRTFVHFERRGENSAEEVAQRSTEWKGPAGITIGTDLKTIERVNRKPFRLAGFGWDGSGTVVSWNGGRLASEGGCYLMLRLTPPEKMIEETKSVTGDAIFSSGHPAMQKVNPTVYQIILSFDEGPKPARR